MGKALTYVERRALDFGSGLVDGWIGEPTAVRVAREEFAALRARHGIVSEGRMLTPPTSQPKLAKSERWSVGMMLTPARGVSVEIVPRGRGINLCPMASKGCTAACLGPNSGKGVLDNTRRSRDIKTAFLLEHAYLAGVLVGREIHAEQRKHGDVNLRLNTVSDIRWELIAADGMKFLMGEGVRLYDYTAWRPESRGSLDGYHLTYSAKEPEHTPDDYLEGLLSRGLNVAMPFAVSKGKPLPSSWHGFPVIDGDLSDDRTLDPAGVVVGLRQKGRVKDSTGFIRSV